MRWRTSALGGKADIGQPTINPPCACLSRGPLSREISARCALSLASVVATEA